MELLLAEKEVIDLGKNVQGLKIVCTEGRCWITQSGDHRDHILGAGSCFHAKSGGHLIVTATGTCQLKLSKPQKRPFPLFKRLFRPRFSALHLT